MSLVHLIALIVGGVAAVFVFGYATGRRVGLRQGGRKARARAPLEMRAEAHELGRCPVCDTMWHEGVSG